MKVGINMSEQRGRRGPTRVAATNCKRLQKIEERRTTEEVSTRTEVAKKLEVLRRVKWGKVTVVRDPELLFEQIQLALSQLRW